MRLAVMRFPSQVAGRLPDKPIFFGGGEVRTFAALKVKTQIRTGGVYFADIRMLSMYTSSRLSDALHSNRTLTLEVNGKLAASKMISG